MRKKIYIELTSERMFIHGRKDDVEFIINNWIEEEFIIYYYISNVYEGIAIEAPRDQLYTILTNISNDVENEIHLI